MVIINEEQLEHERQTTIPLKCFLRRSVVELVPKNMPTGSEEPLDCVPAPPAPNGVDVSGSFVLAKLRLLKC